MSRVLAGEIPFDETTMIDEHVPQDEADAEMREYEEEFSDSRRR